MKQNDQPVTALFKMSAAAAAEMATLKAWAENPATPDSHELRELREQLAAHKEEVAARNGGDDAAMAAFDWLVPGDQLQTLLTHCADDKTKARVSLDAYPIPMQALWCWPDLLDDLLNEAGASYLDLGYKDLYVGVLQQMQGRVLQQMKYMIGQMLASLTTQVLAENAEKHHVPYEWPSPLAEQPFSCLRRDDPVTAAVRSMHWETVDASESSRPVEFDRTYVRRVIDSTYRCLPIMPLTNETMLSMTEGE